MKLETMKKALDVLVDKVEEYLEPVSGVSWSAPEAFTDFDSQKFLEAADCAECAASYLNTIADLLQGISVKVNAHQIANKICSDSAEDETADEYAGVNRDFSGGGRYDGT